MNTTKNKTVRNLYMFMVNQAYSWKEVLAYRQQFISYLFYAMLAPLTTLVFVSVIYGVSNGIAGWSYYQLLLLSSTGTLVSSAVSYLINVRDTFEQLLRGGIDVFLTKPYPVILVIFSRGTKFTLASILGSVAVIGYAMSNITATPLSVIEYVLMVAIGSITMAMFILAMVLTWYKRFMNGNWLKSFSDLIFNFGGMPLGIYGLVGTILFTVMIPVGIAVYYPAELLIGRLGSSEFALFVMLALVFLYALNKYIGRQLNSYNSAAG